MKLKSVGVMLRNAVRGFGQHGVLRLGAALAYYSMFSIGPLLIIVMGLAGLVFSHETVRQEVQRQLQGFIGTKAAHVIESMTAARSQSSSLVATIVGIGALLFGATGVFAQLQDALNTIWEVKAKPGEGIRGFLRDRVLSFAMILGIGFLLLISMALTTMLSAFTGAIGNVIRMPDWMAHVLNFVVSFVVIALLFAAIFKLLPDVKLRWRDVWIAATGTAFLFNAGKYVLGWYLGRESTSSSYGAAGSVIVILMWVFYGSLILFFGAEFTRAYALQTGSKVEPTKYAVRVTDEELAHQGMGRPEKVETTASRKHAAFRLESPPAPSPAAHAGQAGLVSGKSTVRHRRRDARFGLWGLTAAAGFLIGALLESKWFGDKSHHRLSTPVFKKSRSFGRTTRKPKASPAG